jgi:XapX domain-containing protein
MPCRIERLAVADGSVVFRLSGEIVEEHVGLLKDLLATTKEAAQLDFEGGDDCWPAGGIEMKVLFVSFAVGLGVGVIYGLIRVKSPAPPIVALLGLLGVVFGEQLGIWIQAKKLNVTHAANVCLVGERYDRQHPS